MNDRFENAHLRDFESAVGFDADGSFNDLAEKARASAAMTPEERRRRRAEFRRKNAEALVDAEKEFACIKDRTEYFGTIVGSLQCNSQDEI